MSEITQTSSEPPLPPVSRRSSAFKTLALAVFIFICGVATGWAAKTVWHRPPPPMMGMAPEPPVNVMVDQLREELLLSDQQATQVKDIYQERYDALRGIREKMEPQLKSEYDKLRDQMKTVLNPAQFQRWNERFENVRNRMLPPPPRPEGGPPMMGRRPPFGDQQGGGPPMDRPPGPGFRGPPRGPFGGPPDQGGPDDGPPRHRPTSRGSEDGPPDQMSPP
jgi:hypothetical protein